jgi:hypothetical protein
MDRVTVEDIDDRVPSEHEDTEVNLAALPSEDGVRYLMSHGMAEMDARFLIARAKGEVGSDARPVRSESDVRTA